MRYSRIGVVGAGTIGVGVAQSLAQTQHRVTLVDLSEGILGAARQVIRNHVRLASLLDPSVGEVSESEVLERIHFTCDYGILREVDAVIENVTESWPIKSEVYRRLGRICRPDCIIAANTSAIAIGRLAGETTRPERVIGMHFMNPVPQKPVVEVIRSAFTSEETLAAAEELLRQLGKRGIVVNDRPGFVSNRVLMLMINEAIFVLQDEVAEARAVDEIFVQCCGHKLGPLATADLIGLDTVLSTLEVLHESYADPKFKPCPLLESLVAGGRRGRKTGRGFFEYSVGRAGRGA